MTFRLGLLTLAFAVSLVARMKPDTALDDPIKAQIGNFPGKVYIAARNLKTNAEYVLRANEPVKTASTIKLAIMIECFYEVAEGKLKWSEPVKLTEDEKVSGSGILQDFSPGQEFPIRDLVGLMIVLSDNTATNLILNRIGGNAVNVRMLQTGLTATRVMRKILGDGNNLKPTPSGVTDEGARLENKRWGIGRTTEQEMLTLMVKLNQGALVNPKASGEMLDILKKQRDLNGIARHMKDTKVADKTGALDHLRSDVGLVYSSGGPIAIAITVDEIPDVDWGPDNAGNLLISALSDILLKGLSGPQ